MLQIKHVSFSTFCYTVAQLTTKIKHLASVLHKKVSTCWFGNFLYFAAIYWICTFPFNPVCSLRKEKRALFLRLLHTILFQRLIYRNLVLNYRVIWKEVHIYTHTYLLIFFVLFYALVVSLFLHFVYKSVHLVLELNFLFFCILVPCLPPYYWIHSELDF